MNYQNPVCKIHRKISKASSFMKQLQILRKAHERLTFVDKHGNLNVLIGETDHYNLGVVSWMLFNNYKRFDKNIFY